MIALYAGVLAAASIMAGTLSEYFGSLGVLAMIASFVLLIEALISRKERYSYRLFPNLAIIGSLIACICWIGTYVLGAAYV